MRRTLLRGGVLVAFLLLVAMVLYFGGDHEIAPPTANHFVRQDDSAAKAVPAAPGSISDDPPENAPETTAQPKPNEPVDPTSAEDPTDPAFGSYERGQLIVSLPPHPGGAKGGWYTLCAEQKNLGVLDERVSLGTRREDHVMWPGRGEGLADSGPGVWCGEYKIYLVGSGFNGYSPAPLCEPVSVVVKADQTTRIELPDIAKAPWQYTAGHLRVSFSCGIVESPLVYGDAGNHSQQWRSEWLPSGLPDGDHVIKPRIVEPEEDGGDAEAIFEFAPRIDLTIRAGGNLASAQYKVILTAKTDYGAFSMLDYISRGTGSLWAPVGEATLTIISADRTNPEEVFTKTFEVLSDGVAHIEADLDFVEVTLTGGGRDVETWIWNATAPDWAIVRVDTDKPVVIKTLALGKTEQPKIVMKKGLYRAIPLMSDGASAREFDTRDGLSRTVDLPLLSAASLGEIELTLDVELGEGDSVSEDLFWQPACEAPEMREYAYPLNRTNSLNGEHGLTVKQVPLNCDIYLFGVIRVNRKSGPQVVYQLKPIRVNATASGKQYSAEWLPSRVLFGTTGKLKLVNVSLVPGHAFPTGTYPCVPIGENELLVLKPDGSELLRDKIQVGPEDDRLPDAIVAMLKPGAEANPSD